jgi:hypothetical protein
MCCDCANYIKLTISNDYMDRVSHSSKREYIHYEVR